MKNWTRVLALILALSMTAGMVPAQAVWVGDAQPQAVKAPVADELPPDPNRPVDDGGEKPSVVLPETDGSAEPLDVSQLFSASDAVVLTEANLNLQSAVYPHPYSGDGLSTLQWPETETDAVKTSYYTEDESYSGYYDGAVPYPFVCAEEGTFVSTNSAPDPDDGYAYSYAAMSYSFLGMGTLSYEYKHQCEEADSSGTCDAMLVVVDGVVVYQNGGVMEDFAANSIVFDSEGLHTIAWMYSKDSSYGEPQDKVWIRNITFTGAEANSAPLSAQLTYTTCDGETGVVDPGSCLKAYYGVHDSITLTAPTAERENYTVTLNGQQLTPNAGSSSVLVWDVPVDISGVLSVESLEEGKVSRCLTWQITYEVDGVKLIYKENGVQKQQSLGDEAEFQFEYGAITDLALVVTQRAGMTYTAGLYNTDCVVNKTESMVDGARVWEFKLPANVDDYIYLEVEQNGEARGVLYYYVSYTLAMPKAAPVTKNDLTLVGWEYDEEGAYYYPTCEDAVLSYSFKGPGLVTFKVEGHEIRQWYDADYDFYTNIDELDYLIDDSQDGCYSEDRIEGALVEGEGSHTVTWKFVVNDYYGLNPDYDEEEAANNSSYSVLEYIDFDYSFDGSKYRVSDIRFDPFSTAGTMDFRLNYVDAEGAQAVTGLEEKGWDWEFPFDYGSTSDVVLSWNTVPGYRYEVLEVELFDDGEFNYDNWAYKAFELGEDGKTYCPLDTDRAVAIQWTLFVGDRALKTWEIKLLPTMSLDGYLQGAGISSFTNDPTYPWSVIKDADGEWTLLNGDNTTQGTTSSLTVTVPAGYKYLVFDLSSNSSAQYQSWEVQEDWDLVVGRGYSFVDAPGALPSGYRSMGPNRAWSTKVLCFEDLTVPHTVTFGDSAYSSSGYTRVRNIRLLNALPAEQDITRTDLVLQGLEGNGCTVQQDGWYYDFAVGAIASGNPYHDGTNNTDATLTITTPGGTTALAWKERYSAKGTWIEYIVDGTTVSQSTNTPSSASEANLTDEQALQIYQNNPDGHWLERSVDIYNDGQPHTVQIVVHNTNKMGSGPAFDTYWIKDLRIAVEGLPEEVYVTGDPDALGENVCGANVVIGCPVDAELVYTMYILPRDEDDRVVGTINGVSLPEPEKVNGKLGYTLGKITSRTVVQYYVLHADGTTTATRTFTLVPDYSVYANMDLAHNSPLIRLNTVVDGVYCWTRNDAYSNDAYIAYSPTNQGVSNSASNLCVELEVENQGYLYFEYKTYSEPSYDSLCYKIGLPVLGSYSSYDYTVIDSGDKNSQWHECSIPVSGNGKVKVYLAYKKDGSVDRFGDTVAIRNMRFITGNISVTLAASSGGSVSSGGVLNTGANTVPVGSVITLTAVPDAGNVFYGWYSTVDGEKTLVSRETSYTFVVSAACTLEPLFAPEGAYVAIVEEHYPTLQLALEASAAKGKPAILIRDFTLTEDVTIPAGATLLVPFDADDHTGYALGTGSNSAATTPWYRGAAPYCTLTVPAGKTLTVNGALIVGGVQHHPDQSAQAHTSGAYGCIDNAGSIVITGGSYTSSSRFTNGLELRGLIKGEGTLTLKSTGVMSMPFLVTDYAGGTNTDALYSAGVFPFGQFGTNNLQCPFVMEGGAFLNGLSSLYFWSSVHTQDIPLVGVNEGLIRLPVGSTLRARYDGEKAVKATVGNIHLGDMGKTTLTIEGDAAAGAFDLYGYGSTAKVLNLPYTYDLEIASGTFTLPYRYRVMPGAVLTVAQGATLAVAAGGELQVTDGWQQSDKSGKLYPSSATLKAWGYVQNGALVVDGTLHISGSFGGVVQTSGATGRIRVDEGATLYTTETLSSGCSGGYTNNSVSYTLPARIYPVGGTAVEPMLKKNYKASGATEWTLESYTVSGYNISAPTVTIDQAVKGAWIPVYTVTLVDYNGAVSGTAEVESGSTYTPADPTREDFQFLGWYTDSSLTTAFDPTAPITGDLTLYEKWSGQYYTLTLQANGGAFTDGSSEKKYSREGGSALSALPEPQRAGYRFLGWTGLPEKMPEEDLTVTAAWESYLDVLQALTITEESLETARGYYALLTAEQIAEYKSGSNASSNWAALSAAIKAYEEGELPGRLLSRLDETNAQLSPQDGTIARMAIDGQYIDVCIQRPDYLAQDMLKVQFLKELFTLTDLKQLDFPQLDGKTWEDGSTAARLYTLGSAVGQGVTSTDQFQIMFRTAWSGLAGLEAYKSETETYTTFYQYLYAEVGSLTIGVLDGTRVDVTLKAVTAEGVAYEAAYIFRFYNLTHTATFNWDDVALGAPEGSQATVETTLPIAEGEAVTPVTAAPTKTGYTFLGWSAEGEEGLVTFPVTMARTDLSYRARWQAESVSVKLIYHDDVTADTALTGVYYDDLWSSHLPESWNRTGYAFRGWSLAEDGEVLASDARVKTEGTVEVHALWTLGEPYTISYFDSDGTTPLPAGGNPTQYTVETETFTLKAPSREGYTFLGWTGSNGNVPQLEVRVEKGSSGNLFFQANWQINIYTVSYDLNGGDSAQIPAVTAAYGTAIVRPADPSREGHTFLGWDVDGNGKIEADKDVFPVTVPAGDLTLTAVWEKNRYSWTVTANGSSESSTIYYGEVISLPKAPAKEGYTFVAWSILVGGTAVTALPDTMPAAAVELTAEYRPNSYTVHFSANGEAVTGTMADLAMTYDQASALPENGFARTGYTLQGWATAPEGPAAYQDGAQVTNLTAEEYGKVTLYAVWKANTYTVHLDPGAGCTVSPETVTVTYDAPYGALPTPVNGDGSKVFAGWYLGSEAIVESTVVRLTGEVTMEGRWSSTGNVSYRIKHYQQNVTGDGYSYVETTIHTDGSAEGSFMLPQRQYEGFHTAPGSAVEATVNSDGSSILELRYDRNSYTVVWNYQGRAPEAEELLYGVVPDDSTRRGNYTDKQGEHIFTGWDKPVEAVTGDVTYTARYATDYVALNLDRQSTYGTLAEALWEAAAGETVRLDKGEYTLEEDLTVPAGVTLLLPCVDGDPGYMDRGGMAFNQDGPAGGGQAVVYTSLTVPAGVTLTVEGRVMVNAVTGVAQAGHHDQVVTGGFAQLVLEGTLQIKAGGSVDNFGSIGGSGKVTVAPGGTVADLYVVRNWRGGSQALKMYERGVYPMNEYDCKQITATIEMAAGSSLVGLVKMYAQDSYYYTRFPLIDNGNGLIRLSDGAELVRTVTLEGREVYTITGGAQFAGSTLPIVGVTLSTKDFLYPVDGDIDFVLRDGTYTAVNSFKLMPGATVEAQGARIVVEKEAEGLSKRGPVNVVLYTEMNDPGNQGTEYPSDRGAAVLTLDGESTLHVAGNFAGTVALADEADGENITFAAGAGYTMTTSEADGYMNADAGYVRTLEHGPHFTWDGRTGWVEEQEDGSLEVKWSCGDGQHHWVQTGHKDPTCTEEGEDVYTCTICSLERREPIQALGHAMVHTPAKEPTETEEGNYEYWTCTRCGKLFKDEAGTEETTLEEMTIPATGSSTPPVTPNPGSGEEEDPGPGSGGGTGSGSGSSGTGSSSSSGSGTPGEVIVVNPDGSTESGTVSVEEVQEAVENGQTLVLPIAPVVPGEDSESAPTVQVDFGTGEELRIAIPVEESEGGIVAVIVYPDGREEVVRKSVVTEDGLVLNVQDGSTVKILNNAQPFSDVGSGYWAENAIAFASSHELLVGTGDGGFSPEMVMTRGMLAQVLNNLEDNELAAGNAQFSDIEGNWFEGAIDWAAERNIISGGGDGKFYPNEGISREQLVTMLYRYAGRPNTRGTVRDYADGSQVSGYARRAMEWAVESGVISGTDTGLLAPGGAASRAQVAVILQRFCVYMAGR